MSPPPCKSIPPQPFRRADATLDADTVLDIRQCCKWTLGIMALIMCVVLLLLYTVIVAQAQQNFDPCYIQVRSDGASCCVSYSRQRDVGGSDSDTL